MKTTTLALAMTVWALEPSFTATHAGSLDPSRDLVGPSDSARGLLRRLLPAQADSFVLEPISSDQGRDVFEIESRGRTIVLRGNNGVAMASALNWYLKSYCHCHLSLKARQLKLPDPLAHHARI